MVVRIYSWRPRKRDASSANNLQFEKKASENTFKTKNTARIDPWMIPVNTLTQVEAWSLRETPCLRY